MEGCRQHMTCNYFTLQTYLSVPVAAKLRYPLDLQAITLAAEVVALTSSKASLAPSFFIRPDEPELPA